MRVLPSLLFLVSAICPTCVVASAPSFDRQPERPAWERTVTPQLVWLGDELSAPDLDKLSWASSLSGPTFEEKQNRAARLADTRPLGLGEWWGLALSIPAADAATPLVLEIDESRVIEEVRVNGRSGQRFDCTLLGDRWFGGEGSLLLPVMPNGGTVTVLIRSRRLPQLYPNAFGQLRLRPAILSECLRIGEPKDGQVDLQNLTQHPITGQLAVRHEDYFGVEISRREKAFSLAPGASQKTALNAPAGKPDYYKTRVWAESGGRTTLDHWQYPQGMRTQWQRPYAQVLPEGWEFVSVPGPHATNPPPTTGWKQVRLPHSYVSKEFKTNFYYYRRTLDIPADWVGQRVRLFLAQAMFKAVFFLDGQPFSERYNWQLPGWVDLPETARAGERHELIVAITDYTVGLAPGFTAPSGARSQAAPIGESAGLAGLFCIPELITAPALRTERAIVRTLDPRGKPSLEGSVTLNNATTAPAKLRLKAAVFARGEEQFTVLDQSVKITPGAGAPITYSKAFPSPHLWRPEDPFLYELRVTLTDELGVVVDTFRERFGFREFTTDDDGDFRLNGDKVFFLGGSHRLPLQSLWPFTPEVYRWVRGMLNTPTQGLGYGVRTFQACDEIGVFTKGEDALHNALHSDKYAYQLEVTWERLESQQLAFQSVLGNSPSIVMWDLGNELKYDSPGEPERMGKLYQKLREADPTRIVTDSGGQPGARPRQIIDVHGTPNWDDRTDYFFYHPEERPSYWRDAGFFHRPARGEPAAKWTFAEEGTQPRGWLYNPSVDRPEGGLVHNAGKPIFYSEGNYVENIETSIPYGLVGFGGYLPLPTPGLTSGFNYDMAFAYLTRTAVRRESIATTRTSGMNSTMLHVDRGVGRWALPLAVFSLEKRARFTDGAPFRDTFLIHNNTSAATNLETRWALYDGDRLAGEFKHTARVAAGGKERIEVEIPAPAAGRDTDYRLEVVTHDPAGRGYYREDLAVASFAQTQLKISPGVQLALFDPSGAFAAILAKEDVAATSLPSLDAWHPPGQTLLIAPDALAGLKPDALTTLRDRVDAGGRVIVFQQKSLPAFLRTRLTQSEIAAATAVPSDVNSPLTRGLSAEDFRYWQTVERDFITYWYPLEIPATGNVRAHVVTGRLAPLLEVREGDGRVIFCQLNLVGALARDPAARRVLANLLAWSPVGGGPRTLVIDRDVKLTAALRNRLGLVADYEATPPPPVMRDADLIIAAGTGDSVKALASLDAPLRARLNSGARLFLQGLDADGAAWLTRFTGSQIDTKAFAQDRAWPLVASPITAGLNAGDFYWGQMYNRDITKSLEPAPTQTGYTVVTGAQVMPLLNPAYLVEIPVGSGKIVVSTLRSFEYPIPKAVRAFNTVLDNLGARLAPEKISANGSNERWLTQPVNLAAHVNWSLSDDDQLGARRGWTMAGPDNDLRGFPVGAITLRGVNYLIADPVKNKGNSLIALSRDQQAAGFLPERKGIMIDRKAERLYLLHATAWGTPNFIYRVWYKEDRAAYIFGKADPFVDVQVKANENIDDWWFGGQVDRGDRFLPGATVAWKGMNEVSRKTYNSWEVGVYQMTWDNPHPEKTIESVDILLPPGGGNGQLFIFGIATGDRAPAAAPASPKIETLLPGVSAEQVYKQYQRDAYGFVMIKNGTIPVVYGRDGRPAFRLNDWILQASLTPTGEPPQFKFLGGQLDRNATLAEDKDADGNPRIKLTKEDALFPYTCTITVQPDRLRFAYEGVFKGTLDEGWGLNWVLPVSAIKPVKGLPRPGAPTPPRVFDDEGLIWSVEYPEIYAAWGATRASADAGGVTFYMPLKTGERQTATYELVAP